MQVTFSMALHLSRGRVSQLNPEFTDSAGPLAQQGLRVRLCLPSTGITDGLPCTQLLCDAGDQNSSPRACTTSVLATGPSSQPPAPGVLEKEMSGTFGRLHSLTTAIKIT